MSEQQNQFLPNSKFPEGEPVPQRQDILNELSKFGIRDASQIKLIDSTHDALDIRLNYIIDKKWVIRFCNDEAMTEARLSDLHRLIDRYHALGILCPQFLNDGEGRFLHMWKNLQCYLSEYVDLEIAWDVEISDKDRLICEVQASLAQFAQTYRNTDLSSTMGMYSLFDLSPFDIPNGIDEKEDNFNQLIALLREAKENAIADALIGRHSDVRSKLKAIYKDLPRCVFQGDENFSNVLVDEKQHFAGFIDFNLAGTEVIVNQMANVAGFDYNEEKKECIGAQNRLSYALRYFQSHIRKMLCIYHASEQEILALRWYAWIVMIAQWPTFCYFQDAIKGTLKSEILELLSLIAVLPVDQILPAD